MIVEQHFKTSALSVIASKAKQSRLGLGGRNPCFLRAEFALAYAKGSYSGRIGAVAGRGMFGKPPGGKLGLTAGRPLFFVRPSS